MPHLIVEHSSNLALDSAKVLAALNTTCCASPAITNESDFKARLHPLAHYRSGLQDSGRGFIHAQLRLLPGRSPEAKKDLAERILSVLTQHAPQPQGVEVQISVEMAEMDKDSFCKTVLPAQID